MALKQFNPMTPGQRNLVLVDKSSLYKGKPVKKLTEGLTKTGGRNNSGHVTSWQKGGGHKRKYRMIDFKRTKTGMMATCLLYTSPSPRDLSTARMPSSA